MIEKAVSATRVKLDNAKAVSANLINSYFLPGALDAHTVALAYTYICIFIHFNLSKKTLHENIVSNAYISNLV